MYLQPRLKMMREENCVLLHEKTLQVLGKTGVRFDSQKALDILKKNGVKISGNIAYFDQETVEKAISQTPKNFVWRGRNPEQDLKVGEDIVILPNIGNVFVHDLEKGRREAIKEDLINIVKIQQASTVANVTGGYPVDPVDVDDEEKINMTLLEGIKHSDKPVIGNCQEGLEANQISLDMVKLSFGKKDFKDDEIYTGMVINPFSPLAYDETSTDSIIAYAQEGQLVILDTCSMAGVTGPATLAGMVVAQNAEILAGLVLAQLVRPGCPVLSGVSSSISNMQEASYLTGAPDMNIMYMAGTELYEDFYQIPTMIMGGMTDSKTLDYQAGYETMQTLLLPMLSGTKTFLEVHGTMDSFMTTSLEKMILDEEIIARAQHIARGMSFDESDFLLDAIDEINNSDNFLCHESTLEHFSDFWRPSIAEDRTYGAWKRDGSPDILLKAKEIWQQRVEEQPESMITPELEKDLLKMIR